MVGCTSVYESYTPTNLCESDSLIFLFNVRQHQCKVAFDGQDISFLLSEDEDKNKTSI